MAKLYVLVWCGYFLVKRGLHCELVHTGISMVHFWNIPSWPLQSDRDTPKSSKDFL